MSITTARPPAPGHRRSGWAPPLLLALLLAGAGAMAAPPRLQPLVDPPSAEHHVGKFIFAELVTPDVAAAEQFYGGLFGWTFRDLPAGGSRYAEVSLNGRLVAGLVQREITGNRRRQPAWLSFIAVDDVEATRQAALLLGARLLAPPHELPDRGQVAVLADPQGAVFAVLASSSGDPADELAAPGEWIWHSLFTSDADTDVAFYQSLFDYEVFDLPAVAPIRHLMMASGDYARAGANSLPPGSTGSHAHWLNFVRVDDARQAVARVRALGGQVLVEPRVDRQGGLVAIVADPQGAPFGLMEWSANGGLEVAQ